MLKTKLDEWIYKYKYSTVYMTVIINNENTCTPVHTSYTNSVYNLECWIKGSTVCSTPATVTGLL